MFRKSIREHLAARIFLLTFVLLLGAGVPQEDPRYGQPMHNPKVVFNEDVLPLGAALLTAGAMHRLER